MDKFNLSNKEQIKNKLDTLYKKYKSQKEKFKIGKSGYNSKVDWIYYNACQKIWEIKAAVMDRYVLDGNLIPEQCKNGMKQLALVKSFEAVENVENQDEMQATVEPEKRVVKTKNLNENKKKTLSETIECEIKSSNEMLKTLMGSTTELVTLIKNNWASDK